MKQQENKRYPSDLSSKEWEILKPHIPPEKPGGRPRKHPMVEIINAILYVTVSGCQWRMLPKDFPPWKTVYHYFRLWTLDETWQTIHDALARLVRLKAGKKETPSAAILDSQSVKISQKGGLEGMTQARKSRAESAISWSTRLA